MGSWDKEAHRVELLSLAKLKGNARPADHVVEKCPSLLEDITDLHRQIGADLTKAEFLVDLLRRVALDEDSGRDVKCFGDVLDVTGITEARKCEIHVFVTRGGPDGKGRKSDAPRKFTPYGREVRKMVAAFEYDQNGVSWLKSSREEGYASAFVDALHKYVEQGRALQQAGPAVRGELVQQTGDESPSVSSNQLDEFHFDSRADEESTLELISSETLRFPSAPPSAVRALRPGIHILLTSLLVVAISLSGFLGYNYFRNPQATPLVGVQDSEPCLAHLSVGTPLVTRDTSAPAPDAVVSPQSGRPCPQFLTGFQEDAHSGKNIYSFAVPEWAKFVKLKAILGKTTEANSVTVKVHLKGKKSSHNEKPRDSEIVRLAANGEASLIMTLNGATTVELEVVGANDNTGEILWEGWYVVTESAHLLLPGSGSHEDH